MRTLVALLVAFSAQAQTHRKPAPPQKAQHIDITEDETVEGGTPHADGESVTARLRPLFPGMIRIRQDFKPEMLARAADL